MCIERLIPGFAVLILASCTVSDEQEKALGSSTAAQVEEQLPLVQDPDVNAYMTRFGNALARVADDRGLEWRFRVVDATPVNAFAIPGGYVYVNRGLIERAATLSEFAGVLGHEIGHVVLRHSAEQLEKAQKTNIGLTVVCALTSICSSDAARIAINVGGAALFASFSRGDELEADSAAVSTVVEAGIDPHGTATMFEKLLADRERTPAVVEGWFASHPLEEDRIATIRRVIAGIDPSALAGLRADDAEFRTFQDRVRALPPSPPMQQSGRQLP